jgi:hypothetical protein
MDKIGTVQLDQWPKSAWNLFIQSLEEPFRTWLSSCNHLGIVLRPFQKVGFILFLSFFSLGVWLCSMTAVRIRPWSRLGLVQFFETETVLVSEGPIPR